MCFLLEKIECIICVFKFHANDCDYRDIGGVCNAKDCGAAT